MIIMAFQPSAVGAMQSAVPATDPGHGFAFGHPQFALQSSHKPAVGGRVGGRSLTPDRMLSGGIRKRQHWCSSIVGVAFFVFVQRTHTNTHTHRHTQTQTHTHTHTHTHNVP